MHEVLLAHIVGCRNECPVVYILSLEHTVTSELRILKGQIELRSDVLGSEYLDVRLFLFLIGEQGACIRQLGVWSLCVVHRESLRRETPYLVRGKIFCVLIQVPFEEIVSLRRRTCHTKPYSIDICLVERIVVEIIVE